MFMVFSFGCNEPEVSMQRHTSGVGDDGVSVCGSCLFVKDKNTQKMIVRRSAPTAERRGAGVR